MVRKGDDVSDYRGAVVPSQDAARIPALRDYQQQAVDEIRDAFRRRSKSVLFVLSTGGGKTVAFSYIVKAAAEKGSRALILAHRKKLVTQASATFRDFGIEHGLIMSGRSGNRLPVQIGMIGTIANRTDRLAEPDFIVIDEAHHTAAASYRKILDAFPKARVLGVTATPQRTDGAGLGDIFDSMVVGPSMRDLITRGALANYTIFGPPTQIDLSGIKSTAGDFNQNQLAGKVDQASITGDAVAHYRRLVPGKRAVAFCVGVEHAEHVAEQFRGSGIPSERVDGTMDEGEIERAFARFVSGETLVLTSCQLIDEGVDVPAIEAVIDLAPTQSLIRYLQKVGRALRPALGKERAILLDHAGNHRLHGFPDDDRAWSLEGRKKGEKRQLGRIPVTTCRQCFAAYPPSLDRCPHCGSLRETDGRTVEYVDGELVEITPQVEQARQFEEWAAKERAAGRYPVQWPMLNGDAGIVPGSVVKAKDGARQGVKLYLKGGASMFRPFSTMPAEQLRVTGHALGYKPFWAARTNFINKHGRPPEDHEIKRAMAELMR